MQARDRIVADVLDPGGELDVDVFAPDRVAGDDFSAIAGEQRDEIALQIDALHRGRKITELEPSGIDTLLGFTRGISQETLGVEPARPHPRWRQPTVQRRHCGSDELTDVDLQD